MPYTSETTSTSISICIVRELICSSWLIDDSSCVTQYTVRDSYTLGLNAIYQRNYIYIYKYSHSSWIDIQFVTHRWLIVRDSIYSSWLIYSRTQCHIPAKPHLHLQESHSSWIHIQFVTHRWLIWCVTQHIVRDSYTLELNATYQRNPINIYKYSHSSCMDIQFVTHRWLI